MNYINRFGDGRQSGQGHAILHEIVMLMERLLVEDRPGHIDLRARRLDREDIDLLLDVLGEGEGYAELVEYGIKRIRQTGIPGVWWVVHLDEEEQVISEFIEINYTPEALIVPVEDVRDGREVLRARLFEAEMTHKPKREK